MNSLLNDGLSFPDKKEDTTLEEEWRPIPGYVGLYEASNKGQIRSAIGKITSNAKCPVRRWKQRILKPKKGKRNGCDSIDYRVSLWKDGKEKTLLVSRLVAMTWCDGYENELTVNHIDGNPRNNNPNNLEWVSIGENIRKGFEIGLFDKVRKHCVLVDAKGDEKTFNSLSDASLYLGRNVGYLSNCMKRGKLAKNVDGNCYSIKVNAPTDK